jgi:hypothetical protein
MKRLVFCTLLFAALGTGAFAFQQEGKTANVPAAKTNFVGDDDGGLTEIVPADPAAWGARPAEAAPVMKSVQQVSIFLGTSWGDQQVRPRQTALLDLAADRSNPNLAELRNHSVKLIPAAAKVEDFSDLSKSTVNDLTIQRKLVEMFANHIIPTPAANTIYVIFLAPGITSTLGSSKAGTDYWAYHNLLHADGGEVRYVVVPFHQDTDRHNAVAAKAFEDTAFNPAATTN